MTLVLVIAINYEHEQIIRRHETEDIILSILKIFTLSNSFVSLTLKYIMSILRGIKDLVDGATVICEEACHVVFDFAATQFWDHIKTNQSDEMVESLKVVEDIIRECLN